MPTELTACQKNALLGCTWYCERQDGWGEWSDAIKAALAVIEAQASTIAALEASAEELALLRPSFERRAAGIYDAGLELTQFRQWTAKYGDRTC
jgi:hypothetical protein